MKEKWSVNMAGADDAEVNSALKIVQATKKGLPVLVRVGSNEAAEVVHRKGFILPRTKCHPKKFVGRSGSECKCPRW